jgi:Flp pilus assembly pilin Flp
MKSVFARFVTDESGAINFEDGLTVLSLTVGFIAAFMLLNGTVVQLYAAVFGMLPGSH